MDTLNLQHLSLLLDQELVVIPEEIKKHQLSESLKARHAYHPDEEDLYGRSGIKEPIGANVPEKEDQEVLLLNYEGSFEKGLLILYAGKLLEEDTRDFLMKILGAVGYSLKDVALLSSTHLLECPPESFNRLNPHTCLIFGPVSHPSIPPKKDNYEIISEEIVFLFADDLKEIAEHTSLKKKLWASLQVLFHINK